MPLVAFIEVTAVRDAIVDPGTFTEWTNDDLNLDVGQPIGSQDYAAELAVAREHTGAEESVCVGTARIGGVDVAVILGDFAFLAGSVGRLACQRVIAAFARARREGLPVFASPASGGTRMQEGTAAFVLMADVAASVERYRAAGLPLIVWLRNPTTGGVMATWGSLGTITLGEPGALTGFLGPRVFEMLAGSEFPAGVQTTDNLASHGVIDGVVPLVDLRARLESILFVTSRLSERDDRPGDSTLTEAEVDTPPDRAADPWDCVLKTRDPRRPTAAAVLAESLTCSTTLSGTGRGEVSDAVRVELAKWRGQPVLVVAHDRAAQQAGSPLGPSALRVVQRGLRLAKQLQLAVVTIVDTPGAELSPAAEEGALAGEIARCLAMLTTLEVPTVSVLLGMGCGGGALALLPADRVVAAANSWVSPLPLEGASIIRYRSADRAAEMARAQRVAAWQLKEDGIVDVVVPELPDAAEEPDAFCQRISIAVGAQLADLASLDPQTRLALKRKRYGGGVDVT